MCLPNARELLKKRCRRLAAAAWALIIRATKFFKTDIDHYSDENIATPPSDRHDPISLPLNFPTVTPEQRKGFAENFSDSEVCWKGHRTSHHVALYHLKCTRALSHLICSYPPSINWFPEGEQSQRMTCHCYSSQNWNIRGVLWSLEPSMFKLIVGITSYVVSLSETAVSVISWLTQLLTSQFCSTSTQALWQRLMDSPPWKGHSGPFFKPKSTEFARLWDTLLFCSYGNKRESWSRHILLLSLWQPIHPHFIICNIALKMKKNLLEFFRPHSDIVEGDRAMMMLTAMAIFDKWTRDIPAESNFYRDPHNPARRPAADDYNDSTWMDARACQYGTGRDLWLGLMVKPSAGASVCFMMTRAPETNCEWILSISEVLQ